MVYRVRRSQTFHHVITCQHSHHADYKHINPFTADPIKALHFVILVQPTIFNFWRSGALALRTERQSAWTSKIKNGGLDQYGAEPFEQQKFETSGVEGVNKHRLQEGPSDVSVGRSYSSAGIPDIVYKQSQTTHSQFVLKSNS